MRAAGLRSAKERRLRPLIWIFSSLIWGAMLLSIVGAIYAVLIGLFVLMAHALWLAHVRGNGVRIGPKQMPELWARIDAASAKLGLPVPPEAYVLQSGGLLNALATRFLGRPFIILFSSLVDDASSSTEDGRPTALDFVIAHEIGHLACGHLNWFFLPARVVPLLGPAWSRACEYTSDACGFHVVQDLEVSSRALAILAGGRTVGRALDLDAFVEQRRELGYFWSAVYELNASHPYLPKRVQALRAIASPGPNLEEGRNPLAYPLAPFFGFAAAGSQASALFVIMMIGMMAAIAIPSFQKYTERSKQLPLASAPADDDMVLGDEFAWKMRMPGPRWRVLSNEQARKQNPLADRWVKRADMDAHVLVVAEANSAGIDLETFADNVLANAKRTAADLKVLKQHEANGRRWLHTRREVSGTPIDTVTMMVIDRDRAFQVVALAPSKTYPTLEKEIKGALDSFEPQEN